MGKIQTLFTSVIICLVSQIVYGEYDNDSIIWDGIERTYVKYIPFGLDSDSPGYPLVIGMHGVTLDIATHGLPPGSIFIATAGLIFKANREKFIVACPNGLKYDTSYFFNAGAELEDITEGTDDLGFISALIDKMIENYNVDSTRVYAMGHSNGGIMAYRLAAQLPYKIAAIASNSGPMVYTYPPVAPVPIIHTHGLKDPLIDYNGDEVWGVNVPAVDTVMETWRVVNGCNPLPVEIYNDIFPVYDNEGTFLYDNHIIGKRWTSPFGKNDVELYTLSEGGHEWRYNTVGLSATELFWKFLKKHRNTISLKYNDNDSVTITWPSYGENYGYEVKYRDNLSNGEWHTVTPVSQFPIHRLNWTGDSVSAADMRFYKVAGIQKYISNIVPSSIARGSSDVTITIIGHGTNWTSGNVSVDMGNYVTIDSINVINNELLSVTTDISSEAESGRYYDVTVTSNSAETVIKRGGLFITE